MSIRSQRTKTSLNDQTPVSSTKLLHTGPTATTILPDQEVVTTVMPEEGRADSTESVELSSEASVTDEHKYADASTEAEGKTTTTTTTQTVTEPAALSTTTAAPPTSRGEQARADE